MTKRLGSIEAGGTKFVLAVLDENFTVITRKQIPTTTPELTLGTCVAFFKSNPVDALGIGSFGPIGVNVDQQKYGYILETPKQDWTNTNVVGYIRSVLEVPIYFTTDVNASAYGEYVIGAGKDVDSLVYFTIGTGIGGGAIQNGKFVGGISHSEMGHAVAMQRSDDHYEGGCPFHGNRCFEGLAAGPTIEARIGVPGEKLSRTNKVFDLISYYAAQLAYDAFVNLAPAKIVFGGSVLSKTELPTVRRYFDAFNQGYVRVPEQNDLIVMSAVPNNGSATVGDAALALRMLGE